MRHIHLIGICGTFMAGIASLAKAMGFHVTGSDEGVYPPMSTMLNDLGIEYFQGFDAKHLSPAPDVVLVGNATKRGNPEFEAVLSHRMAYQSAPEWLYQHVMRDRVIFAVAGTHGKTTTSAMLVHALRKLGQDPGFLIGGLPHGFEASAHLGQQYFVVEADEYDTALFDKRSKFLHYHPDFLALNNLEFDHADIFRDL
ncbi:MAG: UDP-N-acetylmuramate:L-alanyl-gamma-D-glutamyl-meso-diaminopimelate ligase, partial [Gammaproteobacteria bacterium CG12_big_fil_rev_8_21_14_0_65_46_12]